MDKVIEFIIKLIDILITYLIGVGFIWTFFKIAGIPIDSNLFITGLIFYLFGKYFDKS